MLGVMAVEGSITNLWLGWAARQVFFQSKVIAALVLVTLCHPNMSPLVVGLAVI